MYSDSFPSFYYSKIAKMQILKYLQCFENNLKSLIFQDCKEIFGSKIQFFRNNEFA